MSPPSGPGHQPLDDCVEDAQFFETLLLRSCEWERQSRPALPELVAFVLPFLKKACRSRGLAPRKQPCRLWAEEAAVRFLSSPTITATSPPPPGVARRLVQMAIRLGPGGEMAEDWVGPDEGVLLSRPLVEVVGLLRAAFRPCSYAQHDFYHRFKTLLAARVRRFGTPDQAELAAHIALVKFFHSGVHRYDPLQGRGERPLVTYLTTFARNSLRDLQRGEVVWQEHQALFARLRAEEAAAAQDDSSSVNTFREKLAQCNGQLEAVLTDAPPEVREMVELRSQGHTFGEIGQRLHMPLSTVYKRLHDFIDRVRELVEKSSN